MATNNSLCKIISILETELEISKNLLIEENFNKPLTGSTFRFTALELTYLFHRIEIETNCKIDCSLIGNYEFNTILGIANIIDKVKPNENNIHRINLK